MMMMRKEEEEYPAPADFVPPVHCMTARISIQDEPSISLPPDHKRQVQLTKTLRLLKGLQTQHGPTEGPSQPDAPGEAGLLFRKWQPKGERPRGQTQMQTPTPVTDTPTLHLSPTPKFMQLITKAYCCTAARDATRNGDDSHTTLTGARRPCAIARRNAPTQTS
ncbi:hypothetical protein Tco_1273783 [Tanacetum coccineum]